MKIFRLNHVLNASQQVLAKVASNGKILHKLIRLEKGKVYKLGDYDEESLKSHTTQVRYTKESEQYLIDEGVEYEIVLCRSCGGKKKKLKLKTVEILEADPSEWEDVK